MSTQHTPMELGTNVGESNVGESNVGAPSMNLETDSAPHDEVQSLLPTEDGARKRKLTSDVWKHFKKKKVGDKTRAICSYCGGDFLGESSQGTSHLRKHFRTCRRRPTRDIRQALIKTENVGNETVVVGSYAFNQDVSRRQVARMIALHEYPMQMVDHIGFRDFCASMQPLFKVVSRNTIKSDIMKRFEEEKESTMKLFSRNQSRVDKLISYSRRLELGESGFE